MDNFKRKAIVFGASSGIGKSISLGLASNNNDICIVSRSLDKLNSLKKEIKEKYPTSEIHIFQADISNSEQLYESLNYAYESLGNVDILINNGGGPALAKYDNISNEEWNHSINLIFKSAVFATTFVAKRMEKNNWGRIITISSTVAKEPTPQMIISASLRAGVISYMKSISKQLAPYGITVNVVCPGGVFTERVLDLTQKQAKNSSLPFEEVLKKNTSVIPLGRLARPEEFCEYILFLCSEKSSYITGTCLNVDGGLSRSI